MIWRIARGLLGTAAMLWALSKFVLTDGTTWLTPPLRDTWAGGPLFSLHLFDHSGPKPFNADFYTNDEFWFQGNAASTGCITGLAWNIRRRVYERLEATVCLEAGHNFRIPRGDGALRMDNSDASERLLFLFTQTQPAGLAGDAWPEPEVTAVKKSFWPVYRPQPPEETVRGLFLTRTEGWMEIQLKHWAKAPERSAR